VHWCYRTNTDREWHRDPRPGHPGMVSNCNKFVYVNPATPVMGVAFFNGPISTADFIHWNTGVGGQECRGCRQVPDLCLHWHLGEKR